MWASDVTPTLYIVRCFVFHLLELTSLATPEPLSPTPHFVHYPSTRQFFAHQTKFTCTCMSNRTVSLFTYAMETFMLIAFIQRYLTPIL